MLIGNNTQTPKYNPNSKRRHMHTRMIYECSHIFSLLRVYAIPFTFPARLCRCEAYLQQHISSQCQNHPTRQPPTKYIQTHRPHSRSRSQARSIEHVCMLSSRIQTGPRAMGFHRYDGNNDANDKRRHTLIRNTRATCDETLLAFWSCEVHGAVFHLEIEIYGVLLFTTDIERRQRRERHHARNMTKVSQNGLL